MDRITTKIEIFSDDKLVKNILNYLIIFFNTISIDFDFQFQIFSIHFLRIYINKQTLI